MAKQRFNPFECQRAGCNTSRSLRRTAQEAAATTATWLSKSRGGRHRLRGISGRRRWPLTRILRWLRILRRLAQEATSAGLRLRLCSPLLQIAYLLLSLLQSHILNQHGLRHQVKRVRTRANVPANELFGFRISLRRWSLLNLRSQVAKELVFFWGHDLNLPLQQVRRSLP